MNLYNPPAGTIRASLRYRAFRWLLSGLAVSQTGNWLYNLALVTMVYEGSTTPDSPSTTRGKS